MKIRGRAVFAALAVLIALPALADTLVLRSGERISGYFEGGSARIVKFRGPDGAVKDYDILSVQQIQFEADKPAADAAAPEKRPEPALTSPPSNTRSTVEDPRLLPAGPRPAKGSSENAAGAAHTVPSGSQIVIRMIDSVNSEKNRAGDTFMASLDEPIVLDGLELVPKGADVRGRIANINEAGRIAGAAELGLELTGITVNGIPYSINTAEYQEVAENRSGETAKRATGGAAVGAIIGAIAGGAKGAAIGAGIGAGGATAVQVLTKGDKLNIPSETRLEFTLKSPLVIAAK